MKHGQVFAELRTLCSWLGGVQKRGRIVDRIDAFNSLFNTLQRSV